MMERMISTTTAATKTDPVVAALEAARALLADPARFTRSHTARNRRGGPTSPLAATAVR